jgi:hypothetical protein
VIDYARFLALRWLRRTGGRGGRAALLAMLLWPTLWVLGCLFWLPSRRQGLTVVDAMRQLEDPFEYFVFPTSIWIALGALLCLVNLVVTAIHDEKLEGRARLLRASGVDGAQAVIALLLLAALLAVPLVALGFLGPVVLCLPARLVLADWLPLVAATVLGVAAGGPIAVLARLMLPHSLALLLANTLAVPLTFLVAGLFFDPDYYPQHFWTTGEGLLILATVVLVEHAMVATMPLVWRSFSWRFWP